jgi:hypothetical protein
VSPGGYINGPVGHQLGEAAERLDSGPAPGADREDLVTTSSSPAAGEASTSSCRLQPVDLVDGADHRRLVPGLDQSRR